MTMLLCMLIALWIVAEANDLRELKAAAIAAR